MLAACGGQTINPRFQPEISNLTDSFQWQVTGMTNVSQVLSYTWQNTGTTGNVNQATSITAGTALLLIRDAQDTPVYVRDLTQNGTFVTNAGTSGAWKIEVTLSKVSGAINFRVQKHTP